METEPILDEMTLDPERPEEFRALAHRMVDDMLDYLGSVRERPLWRPVPEGVKKTFQEPIPRKPRPEEEVYGEFLEKVLPYPMGNIHPRFWGWVIGTGTPLGVMAEMLAAAMNPNTGGGDHAANYVERQVLDWLKEVMGFPLSASGLLTSGGSMANVIGLTTARNRMAEFDIRVEGLPAAPRRMVMYASLETHSSNIKSAELLGIGREGLRLIPVNDAYEIDIAALEAAITADRAAGFYPYCLIGNAGTVNTGAFDNMDALADVAAREKMWLHVDGAFGACAALSETYRPLTSGMERADSLAFDLHKWFVVPYEAGCVLIRDEEDHRHAFSLTPEYLSHSTRGIHSGPSWFSDYGLELSRGFKALKAWMSFKAHGFDAYTALFEQNIAQARYLAELVEEHPRLEVMAPVPLNITCFRYNPGGLDTEALNDLNNEILLRLHESGIAAPSSTILNGQYVLRAAITNHRSRREDFELVAETVVDFGDALMKM
jgi:glutamate/tyrosine decarboxylase-like PLP-dependent enzyme